MTANSRPKLPIPPPLLGTEGFAHFTVTQRLRAIARQVIVDNNFSASINRNLEKLASELTSGYVPPLVDDTGTDVAAWGRYLAPYQGQRWIDVPWFFAETYFYRLLLEITNYFRPGEEQGVDPFSVQKRQGLETSVDSIVAVCDRLNKELQLPELLYFALWGNRVDLSLWSSQIDRSRFDINSQLAHILVNDAPKVAELLAISNGRIDIVIDNAGFELFCDLCLVDFLLATGVASLVNLHLKPHPTFVSDATIKDLHKTTSFLAAFHHSAVASLGARLQEYIAHGHLAMKADDFWTSPLAFWEMPDNLKSELSSNLIIIKGDANYRRLLGDRHWDYTTNFADIVCYLPSPMVALRTLKSEVVAGISAEHIAALQQTDPDWLINGQWGLIQSTIL
jgi:uncharacterized protein with ATP-grasp and redox domains